MGMKFKFSANNRDLEFIHIFWRSKNPPVPCDLKPPLGLNYETKKNMQKVCMP